MPDGKKTVFEYDHDGIGKVTIEAMDMLMGLITDGRRRGEWIETNEVAWGATLFRCSACGMRIGDAPTLNGKPKFPYCPWCGAKMDVESKG